MTLLYDPDESEMPDRCELGDELNCWLWTGPTDQCGWPIQRWGRTSTTVARALWQERIGPIKRHLNLVSLCGNRRCVRPRHHEPVTAREQARRYGQTKLDVRLAARAKALMRVLSKRRVADLLNVDESVVRAVDAGRHWTQPPCLPSERANLPRKYS